MSPDRSPRHARFRRFETFLTIVLAGLAIVMPLLMWRHLL